MTSISTDTRPLRTADLGTLVIMSWSRETPDGDVPFLLACSLGDGEAGAAFACDERTLASAAQVI
ncbi:DUF5949 family protein, partial [Streptomyces sp. NPDC058829]|uniref:DUF5949 family protein n=1 Tax=Streptomyces sp. NPDC058829 TaxID=3346644 RepID=UPI0036818C04